MNRILCLTIDSDPEPAWRETYEVHRRHWRWCFDACASWVDGYFVRAQPDLQAEYAIDPARRLFTFRGGESFIGILYKVAKAIDVLLGPEHGCVVRTGLSSLYDFNALRAELPLSAGTYAGHFVHGYGVTYCSGAGMVLSPDVARSLSAGAQHADSQFDDVAVAQVLKASGITPQDRPMWVYDYKRGLGQIDEVALGEYLCYRFRDYDDPRRAVERDVMPSVFRKVYG